jgi:hypothetical protein
MCESDEYFVSGSLDMMVRLWSIRGNAIVDYQKTNDIITSLKVAPDGLRLLAGLYKGQCVVFTLDGPKYQSCSRVG